MKDKIRLFVYKNGRNAILWLMLLMIFLYSVRVLELYKSIDSYGEQSVDGLSKNAVFFRIDGIGDGDLDFLADEKKPFAIISQPDTSIPIYLVFQSKDFFKTASGRSFTTDDGTDDKPVMLCGKYADIVCDTGNLYWHGKGPYIQIGELAESGNLLTDYGIFLYERPEDGNYYDRVLILETKERRDSERIYERIEKNLVAKGITTTRIDTNSVRIGMMTDSEKKALIMILISVILLSVSIGFVTVFWLSQYDEERFARSLCGQGRINRVIAADYMIIQISAFAVGTGVALLSHRPVGIVFAAVLFGICTVLFAAILCIKELLGKYADHKGRRGIML